MRSLSETIELWIGCNAIRILVVTFLIFLATVSHFGLDAVWFLLLVSILVAIGVVYYINFSKKRLDNFKDMLSQKAKKSLALPENTVMLTLSKKGAMCNSFLKKKTRKDYELSFVFLTDDYLTIAQKCPKFHLFAYERHGRDKKWQIKDSCAQTKEYRYPFIQSVHFDSSDKALVIVLTSGYEEKIQSDKPDADKAILKIREKLRESERTIQTNLWNK